VNTVLAKRVPYGVVSFIGVHNNSLFTKVINRRQNIELVVQIREVQCSNLGPEIVYSNSFRDFPQTFWPNTDTVPETRPRTRFD
jgi:hypothetical protein